MPIYAYETPSLVSSGLPPQKRLRRFDAWSTWLFWPLQWLWALFFALRIRLNRQVSFTGQVLLLERLLNLHYYNRFEPNPTAPYKPIYIVDGPSISPPVVLYLQDEAVPVPLYMQYEAQPVTLYTQAEGQIVYDFIIMVPSSLVFNPDDMRRMVDRYRYAGTRYTIQTY